jgi:toxin ParE1/3/4
MTFRFGPQAEADIQDIAAYIAMDNFGAAIRWLDQVGEKAEQLGEMPKLGVAVTSRLGLRIFSLGNYLILYREVKNGIEVVRVVHGARQWEKLL